MEINAVKIVRLQRNLPLIRRIAGWSAEHLAEILGVTRQTIVNLENNENYKMSKIQYIAIRAVLEAESRNNKELGQIIDILVDREDISEETKSEIQQTITTSTSNLGRRVGSAAGSLVAIKALLPVLSSISVPAIVATMVASSWIFDIINSKDN